MRLKLISCEIFHREMCAVVARSPNQVDLEFMPKGLHDIPAADMRGNLQAAVDRTPAGAYEAILLGYALCNNGLHGLTARTTPLVLPRAHDCISMFLGSKERYREYFFANPGVYFKTTGWIERDKANGELRQLTIQHQAGMDRSYQDLVDQYGEENARFLYEQLYDMTRHYKQITFIEMGVEPDDRFERQSRELAAERGWTFDKQIGDMGLFQRLVNGDWNAKEYLVVPPGHRVVATQDETIVRSEPAGDAG
ncbi:MAG: DUF1638 domain-containing protein [Lentisphaerae bacterium]|nr:DUF1638 domain-containing protein [Lentisphaerota bacterium]